MMISAPGATSSAVCTARMRGLEYTRAKTMPSRFVQGMVAPALQQHPAVQFRLSVADDKDHFISSVQGCSPSGVGNTLALTSSGSPLKYGRSFSMVRPMSLPPEVAKRATFFPVQS